MQATDCSSKGETDRVLSSARDPELFSEYHDVVFGTRLARSERVTIRALGKRVITISETLVGRIVTSNIEEKMTDLLECSWVNVRTIHAATYRISKADIDC